jgi:hypothetical protein
MKNKTSTEQKVGNGIKRNVSGSSPSKDFVRATHENGKCLHNVGSQDVDGYFRCLYCGSVVEDLANYR